MTTTNKKPTTRKPATTNNNKKANNESFGTTLFLNFGMSFKGNKAKNVSYLNINNIFYNKDDAKDKLKGLRKAFSESKSYKIATEVLYEELSKAMSKAQKKINKKLEKLDKGLPEEEKKDISIFLSVGKADGNKSTDDTDYIF